MFGYVIPDKPNMLVKDLSEYRAYYCGLCKAIGKSYSEKARFLTGYDCTFLAAFLHNLYANMPKFNDEVCILNPVKKKTVCVSDEIFEAVAAVSVLLGYYKAVDDVRDEGGVKKRIFAACLRRDYKKAKRRYPSADKVIKDGYERLSAIEKAADKSVDETADAFAVLLRDLIAVLSGEKCNSAVERFSYALGKWVYLMDAVDDVSEDKQKKRFNPFLVSFGGDFSSKKEFLDKFNEDLSLLLYNCYNQMVAAYNNIEVKVAEGVLSNVVYLGLKAQTEKMLKGEIKCNKIRL